MIISEFRPGPTIADTNRLLDQIVKGRVKKMTNETIEELDRVAQNLTNILRNYRTLFYDYPDLEHIIKRQIDEIKRINAWIKKEVE